MLQIHYSAVSNTALKKFHITPSKPSKINNIDQLRQGIENGLLPSQNDLKRLMRECELNGSFLAVSNKANFKIQNIRMKFFRAAAEFNENNIATGGKEKQFVYHQTYEGVRVFRIK